MDTKDIELIGEFLLKYRNGEIKRKDWKKPSDANSKPKIEEMPDVQLSVCAMVTELQRAGASPFNTLLRILDTEGALEFAISFAEEVTAGDLGLGGIKRELGGKRDELSIEPSDAHLLSRYLPEFKAALLKLIDAQGGITKLAKRIKMSQPSMSRMFHSDAIPRESTLKKIYEALGVDSIKIANPDKK